MSRIVPILCLAGLLSAARAEDRPKALEPLPDLEPAPAGQPDSGLEPQITIVQKSDEKVEEYRIRGRLYKMKVTPKTGKPYWLVDDRGDGQFIRSDNLDSGLRVPRWVIRRF